MTDNTAIDVAYVQSCSFVTTGSGSETKITCARHLALVNAELATKAVIHCASGCEIGCSFESFPLSDLISSVKRVVKLSLHLFNSVCDQNRGPPICNTHCFIASSGLIYSDKNKILVSQRAFPQLCK